MRLFLIFMILIFLHKSYSKRKQTKSKFNIEASHGHHKKHLINHNRASKIHNIVNGSKRHSLQPSKPQNDSVKTIELLKKLKGKEYESERNLFLRYLNKDHTKHVVIASKRMQANSSPGTRESKKNSKRIFSQKSSIQRSNDDKIDDEDSDDDNTDRADVPDNSKEDENAVKTEIDALFEKDKDISKIVSTDDDQISDLLMSGESNNLSKQTSEEPSDKRAEVFNETISNTKHDYKNSSRINKETSFTAKDVELANVSLSMPGLQKENTSVTSSNKFTKALHQKHLHDAATSDQVDSLKAVEAALSDAANIEPNDLGKELTITAGSRDASSEGSTLNNELGTGVKLPSSPDMLNRFSKWLEKMQEKNPELHLPKSNVIKKQFSDWLQKVFSGTYASTDSFGLNHVFDDFLREDVLHDRNVVSEDLDQAEPENDTPLTSKAATLEPGTRSDMKEEDDEMNKALETGNEGDANFNVWYHPEANYYNAHHLIKDEEEYLQKSLSKDIKNMTKLSMKKVHDWLNKDPKTSNSSIDGGEVDLDKYNIQEINDINFPIEGNESAQYFANHHNGKVKYYYDHKPGHNTSSKVNHYVHTVHPCHNGGKIVPLPYGGYQCICKQNFLGNNCEDINYCKKLSPCKNNGTCNPIYIHPRYQCTCLKAFFGKHCEKSNPCEPNVCKNGATCTHDSLGNTSCICKKGFRGTNCEQINTCLPSPCKNGATCEMSETGSFCTCPAGYKGPLCQFRTFCNTHPCQNGGTCRETNENFQCICQDGFLGETCTERPCTPNPCYYGSTCIEEINDYKCICAPWSSGRNCSDVSPCRLKPCRSNGQCLDALSGFRWSFKQMQYYCLCKPPYMGPQCNDIICNHCSPFGHCNNNSMCVCDVGFYGNGFICERQEENPCKPNPCGNGGVCQIEKDNDFSCICVPPFQPPFCQNGNPCEPDPCSNGKCVVESDNTFKCRCIPGYRGSHCNVTDPCHPSPCQNGGACNVTEKGVTTCQCLGKWMSTVCEKCGCPPSPNILERPGTHCLSNGQCACNKFNASEWEIKGRGADIKCVVHLAPTPPPPAPTKCTPDNPCKNGGMCKIDNTASSGYNCTCTQWFYGPDCDILKRCKPHNPCLNKGKCIEDGNGNYTCECPPGTGGWRCEGLPTKPPSPSPSQCTPNPCLNNGTCHPLKNGYDCECLARYTGSICNVDRCQDCDSNARCEKGHCVCKNGYSGNGYECVIDSK